MRQRSVLFAALALLIAAGADAQFPKTVRTEPLVMTGIPPSAAPSPSLPFSTLPFPKVVRPAALLMTGIPLVVPKETTPPPPFVPRNIKTEPLVMTGIPTKEGVK
jgi:hypothetical protein